VLHQDPVVRLKRSTLIRGSLIVMVFLIPPGAGCYSVKGAEEKCRVCIQAFASYKAMPPIELRRG
jgi:hypothetical protein